MKTVHLELLIFMVAAVGGLGVSHAFGRKPSAAYPSDSTPPGVEAFNTDLLMEFAKMRAVRGEGYRPRTRHLRPDGWARYTNRLFLESSPYLLQHAHNPVNWYPWGDEAFEAATRLNRPVLLSVGYSTCHWCHMMEEESFEDEEIARYINENYIAIKVDREERPEIDAIYMSAVQVITGGGGWPMTVWLTPDRKPFFGGTYFPARDGERGAMTGFLTILKNIRNVYHTEQDRVAETGRELTRIIRERFRPERGDHLPTADILHEVVQHYKRTFDPVHGGLAGAPKFPSSFPVRLLLRYYRRTGDTKVLGMARFTLQKMAAGGIYDHVGGGFHRYAVDERWLIPHFEKMLYDNALLVMAYLEGYQVTGDEDFRRIAEEILGYVARDMASPEGAFYSATDADSLTPDGHRAEGYYFTWTPQELEAALGPKRAGLVKAYYGVGPRPHFEGRYILHAPRNEAEAARLLKIPQVELRAAVREAWELLRRYRKRRFPPHRDEKILTAWNGLMISAHARAGLVLGNPQYTDQAVKAANFILNHLYIEDRLYRSYKDGRARHSAYLDDYAFMIAALLDLLEATCDPVWLEKAIELDRILEEYYEDRENGGFFMTGREHEKMIAREKPNYDGAEPSGNSVAILNLLRLGEFRQQETYRQRAEKALSAFLGAAPSKAPGLSEMLLAVDFYLDRPKEIVIVTPEGRREDAEPFLREFRKRFLPNRTIIVASDGEEVAACARLIPGAGNKSALKGKATAYVCGKGYCGLPAEDPAVFAKQLEAVKKLDD